MAKYGLARDKKDPKIPVQGFAPRAEFCQVPQTVNAAATYSALDVSDMSVLAFRPSGAVQLILNAQTTKYMTFDAAMIHVIPLAADVTAVAFKNAGAAAITLEIWGA